MDRKNERGQMAKSTYGTYAEGLRRAAEIARSYLMVLDTECAGEASVARQITQAVLVEAESVDALERAEHEAFLRGICALRCAGG